MLFLKYDTKEDYLILNKYVEANIDIFPRDIKVPKTQKVAFKIILDADAIVYIVYKKYMGKVLSTPIKVALNAGSTLAAGCEYIFETLMPANTEFNVQVSVAQTIKLLNLFFEGVAPL